MQTIRYSDRTSPLQTVMAFLPSSRTRFQLKLNTPCLIIIKYF